MKKVFSILFLFMFIFCGIASADLTIALKQKGDDIFAAVQDNKEEYVCNGKEIIQENGKINIEISCCNCKDECVTIIIPTNKTGM